MYCSCEHILERAVTAMGLTIAAGVYVFLFATVAVHVAVPRITSHGEQNGMAPHHLRGGVWKNGSFGANNPAADWSWEALANWTRLLAVSGAPAGNTPETSYFPMLAPMEPPHGKDDRVLRSSPSKAFASKDWTTPEEAMALAKWDKFLATTANDLVMPGNDNGMLTLVDRYAGSLTTAWHLGLLGCAALVMVLVSVHARAVQQRKPAKASDLPL
jgi:hypothetical protein